MNFFFKYLQVCVLVCQLESHHHPGEKFIYIKVLFSFLWKIESCMQRLLFCSVFNLFSLVNIYKELSSDIEDFSTPKHGNLTGWAKQGKDILIENYVTASLVNLIILS